MPDSRFFTPLGPIRLSDLVRRLGLSCDLGQETEIMRVAPLVLAERGDITFLADTKYSPDLRASKASACFVRADVADRVPEGCVAVIASHPYAAYAMASNLLFAEIDIDAAAPAVHPTAQISKDVVLGQNVVIGAGVRIGVRSRIGANTVIGPGVEIGTDARIGAGVSIRHAIIGDRVQVFANATIGEAGFGATMSPNGLIDVPQLGRVIIGNEVTVGANTAIDRGTWSDTMIDDQAKFDNLVQIAHNCHIGQGTVIAAHSGVSGSVKVGRYVQLGGSVGVADHITIGDFARVGAAAGVVKNIPAKETWAGVPARPMRQWLRELAILARLAKSKPNERKELIDEYRH